MEDNKHMPSEEDLRAIRAMRVFRRAAGLATAALVLVAAIVMALRHLH